MESLKTFCANHISLNITTENAAKALILADMNRASQLKTVCIEFITDHPSEVFATDDWKEISRNRAYLAIDILQIMTSKLYVLKNRK